MRQDRMTIPVNEGLARTRRRTLAGVTSRVLAVIAAAVVAGGTALPGVAVAEPEGDMSLANSPTLNLRTVGIDSTISLYGIEGQQTLSIPVQPGLVPTELVATLALPVNALGGTLEVSQDERIISRVPLPPDQAPITIPLAGARIVDNAVTVLLRSYLTLPEGYCVFDASNPLRLAGTEVRYTGQELAPATVADFLLSFVAQDLPQNLDIAVAEQGQACVALRSAVGVQVHAVHAGSAWSPRVDIDAANSLSTVPGIQVQAIGGGEFVAVYAAIAPTIANTFEIRSRQFLVQ